VSQRDLASPKQDDQTGHANDPGFRGFSQELQLVRPKPNVLLAEATRPFFIAKPGHKSFNAKLSLGPARDGRTKQFRNRIHDGLLCPCRPRLDRLVLGVGSVDCVFLFAALGMVALARPFFFLEFFMIVER
jgi:hypothetical protein